LVGIPVDGPARWMSRISSGSSSVIASPIVSCFRTIPGPAEVQTPSAPPNDAPERRADRRDLVLAWKVRTPKFLCRASSSRIPDAA
jgi:hypothetical protein